jgi:hypothetical protein
MVPSQDPDRRQFLRSAAVLAGGASFGALGSRTGLAPEVGWTQESALRRYLYVSSPDAAQGPHGGGNRTGVYVFDIDDGHRFVRFIDVPQFVDGLRGFCISVANHAAYYSKQGGVLGAFDLEEETVLWEREYELGCDRACITDDGETLYVPSGWWRTNADGGFYVVDAQNGDALRYHVAGGGAHNSLITPDGQYMLIGTRGGGLHVYRVSRNSREPEAVLRFAGMIDADGVFPFTVDSRNRYAYVCHQEHIGFSILDLELGQEIEYIQDRDGAVERRTHGIALTPDETEIWISDQVGERILVYDNTPMPDSSPVLTHEIPLVRGGHGWVVHSLDGQWAWCHTEDIIDARTKEVVGRLEDDQGNWIAGSKYFEAHFRGDRLVGAGTQFGVGRANL